MPDSDWLVGAARTDAALRLICLPHAGGGPRAFAHWADALPPEVQLLTVLLPGRAQRIGEAPVADRARLVARLGRVLEPVFADGPPTVLMGHSLGAVLAFEACRWLAAEGGQRPTLLVTVAHRPPHVPLARAPVHDAPFAALMAELRRLGGTPPEVLDSREMMAVYEPMIRADYALAETWAPGRGAVVNVPLLALGAWDDPDVAPAAIEAWRAHTTSRFAWSMFEGDHFFLHDRPRAVWHAIVRLGLRAVLADGAFDKG